MIKIVIKTVGVNLALLALSGCSSKPSEFQTACEAYGSNHSNGLQTEEMIQEVCSCTDDKFSDIPKKSVEAYCREALYLATASINTWPAEASTLGHRERLISSHYFS